MKNYLSIAVILLICCLTFGQKASMVTSDTLGDHNGNKVCLYTLTNKAGNVLKLTNYGAKIVRIEVPDKNGNKDNVTNGAEKLDMIVKGDPFGGASIGRFANRIANGKFTLDGVEYSLAINNAPNTLHGGRNGWFSKVWTAEIIEAKQPCVKFSYISPDMEEGFPGTVSISVTYTWSDKNEIEIDYAASTDKKTVINVTNHAYFNLHGTGKGYIFDHILTLKASKYTPLNSTKIPTGEIKPVKSTPYDFTTPHPVGYRIGDSIQNSVFQGYDDNFVLDKNEKVCATVYDPESGRIMEVITDQPGLQFYSGMGGMAWKKSVESGTKPASTRSAFALETQHFPDSPNQPGFPSTVLKPGEKFKSTTIYRFSVKND
jgi:aldose 1-epimerase